MQIIVVGCGKIGSALAAALVETGHDVIIIEQDPELIGAAADLDIIKITGVPIDRDVLRQAGIETADVVCAVTQNDNMNIMVAQIAKEIFGVPKIISRIFNPANRPVFEEFGLTTVCSTDIAVHAFLTQIAGEEENTEHRLFGRTVVYTTADIDADLIGTELGDLSTDSGKLIIGLLRHGQLQRADADIKVQKGDELVLADLA